MQLKAFLLILGSVLFVTNFALAQKPTVKVGAVADPELAVLKQIDQRYQSAKSLTMNVEKTLKLGLLEQEKKSKGKAWLASGQLRMELEGEEKTLLIVNKTDLWAVSFPSGDFKDAAVQVIRGNTTNKKTRSQSIVGLLSMGGFTKFFNPSGAQKESDGTTIYFLQPKQDQTDFRRAQIRVSKDGKEIVEIKYWDDRDNETRFAFSNIKFGAKVDAKLFTYKPPANADVMNL